jgi:hypothetical protein
MMIDSVMTAPTVQPSCFVALAMLRSDVCYLAFTEFIVSLSIAGDGFSNLRAVCVPYGAFPNPWKGWSEG